MNQLDNLSYRELASHLIGINTSTDKGVDKAISFLKSWATNKGLSCTTLKGTKALLIETQPLAKKHLCFVTHVDVVSAAGWKSAFKPVIKNKYLIGRGAIDDKGPLAVCLEVLKQSKELSSANISCLVITDEEIINSEIGIIVNDKSFHPDFCLVADGGTHTLLDVGQKGLIRLSLEANTSGGHSAFEDISESAILQLLEFVDELKKFASQQMSAPKFKSTLINISKLVSESVPYGFPSLAKANLEIQFPPPQTADLWTKKLNQLLSRFKNITMDIQWTCEPHSVLDSLWLKMFKSFPEMEFITVGGANLAKDLSLAGIPAVSHCPVTEYMGHCDNERISLSDLEKGVSTYLQLVKIFENFSY